MALWLWLGCALAAAAAATLPGDEGEQTLPPFITGEIIQHEVDPISLELLLQKIHQSEVDGTQFPILIHGEPHPIPLNPRGKRPPCAGEACVRKSPVKKLKEFPPGRPSRSNLANICSAGRKRMTFRPWDLPKTGLSHLSRQWEALDELESHFSLCCQRPEGEKLLCSINVWEQCLIHFCKWEFSIKTRPFHCCREPSKQASLACFASQAPFPAYDKGGTLPQLDQLTNPLLDSLCSQAPRASQRSRNATLVQNITDSCCKLQQGERAPCAEEVKSNFIDAFCNTQRLTWKDPLHCCSLADKAARSNCFNYLDQASLFNREKAVPTEATPSDLRR